MRHFAPALLLSTALAAPALAATPDEVAKTYADIAEATYTDSLTTAQDLQKAVATLIATPSEATLHAARAAWTPTGPPLHTLVDRIRERRRRTAE